MFDSCQDPGYGVEGFAGFQQFVLGRMRDMARGDFAVQSAAIEARTPLKSVAGELVPVTAATDVMVAMMVCDKAAGVTRANVFLQGDFNVEMVNLPDGFDFAALQDTALANNGRIFLKQPIFSGAG